jgi:5'-3' exonuclease
MGQPVRKTIQETHSSLIKDETYYTLLVDGNSLLFNCMADTKVNSRGEHYGGIFQFLLQLKMIMQKRTFKYIYVFFDNEYSGWLRWNLYKPYKENRDKNYQFYGQTDYAKAYNEHLKKMQNYIFNKNKKQSENINSRNKSGWDDFIDANFDRERDILCRYFNELYIRWYIDDVVEGDDLIAYYCQNKAPNEKIYIISSDMDLSQLLNDDIAIYNQQLKKFISNKNFNEYFDVIPENIVIKKIFCGDNSDNIGNIKGLSEKGLMELVPEIKNKPLTIEDVKNKAKLLIDERVKNKKKPLKVHENIINGISNKEYEGDFYEINEKIINLKKPLLTEECKNEMDSMIHNVQDPEGRSFKNLYQYIIEDDILDFLGDTKFASFFSPFKAYCENEINEYKKYVSKFSN